MPVPMRQSLRMASYLMSQKLHRREKFPLGSMGPKVEAVCRFVEITGEMAAIGALRDAARILRGEAGTVVTARTTPAG